MSPTPRVDWTETALDDIAEILQFVAADRGRDRARALRVRLFAAAEQVLDQPLMGRLVPELLEIGEAGIREVIVGPYRLLYRVDGARIVPLTVFDGRRDAEALLLRRHLRGVL